MAKPRLRVFFRVPLTRDFSRLSHFDSLLACLKGLKTVFADNKGQSGPLSFVSKILGKCHYNCQLTSSRSSYENLIYKNLTSFYHSCSCSRKTGDLVFASFYLSKFNVKTKYYCEGSEPRSHLISRLSMIVDNDSPIQDLRSPGRSYSTCLCYGLLLSTDILGFAWCGSCRDFWRETVLLVNAM